MEVLRDDCSDRAGECQQRQQRSIVLPTYSRYDTKKMETILEETSEDFDSHSLEDQVFENEEPWRNQALEISENMLGRERFLRRVTQCNKKHKTGFGSKARLSYISSKIKKLITSSSTGALHCNAVGAMGYAVIRPHPAIPENHFFTKDRRFRVRLRHCGVRCEDDAASCVRQAALKFADQNEDGPLDLILFTGRTALARNCKTFYEVLSSTSSHQIQALCEKDPNYFFALVDCLRRSPFSYNNLHYHSQLPYMLVTKDGKPRMIKFRLIPTNSTHAETGLLSPEDQHTPWGLGRDERNRKAADYLRSGFVRSLHDGPIHYSLQIQIHNMLGNVNDDEHLWNPQNIWDEKEHPWLDLMDLIFTTTLHTTSVNRTAFNIVNRPQCLCIQPPSSMWDFKSYHYSYSNMYTTLELKNMNQINLTTRREGPGPSSNMVSYIVTLSTGNTRKGGMVDVFITLTGVVGRTVASRLDRRLDGHDSSEEKGSYRIDVEDVGDILVVTLGVRHRQLTTDWMLRYVSLTNMDNTQTIFFPCYRVVTSKITLRPGNVCLPSQETHEVLRQERALEIRYRQQSYEWRKRNGLPSTINAVTVKDLPAEERLLAERYTGLPWDLEAPLTEMVLHNKHYRFPRSLRSVPSTRGRRRYSLWEGESSTSNTGTHVSTQPRPKSTLQGLSGQKASMMPRQNPGTGKARQKWNKIKHVLHFITKASAKIPDGIKGDMCRACLEDPDFGRLFIQGSNPLVIRRIRELPAKLGVTETSLEEFMERGLSLSEEMKMGMVFLADYCLLDSAPSNSRDGVSRHTAAPIVLLYVNSSGHLVPIAIQLHQQRSHTNPVWMPSDPPDDWLLAKLWVRYADWIHQLATHMFYCHLVVEPFVVATMRQLSASHPIYKLLKPHIRYLLPGNTMISKLVLSKGGSLDRWTSVGSEGIHLMLKKLYTNFHMDDLDFLLDLKKRDMERTTKVTNYYYRDDGIRLWNALHHYCSNVISCFYESDYDLHEDSELQAWLHDVRENGFPKRADEIGLPQTMSTLDDVKTMMCRIIFTFTCRHAATHSEAMDMYGHVPTVPATMRQPAPSEKGTTRKATVTATLPEQKPELYRTAYMMSLKTTDPTALGQNVESYFVESQAKDAHDCFCKQLNFISKMIKKRNEKLEHVYDKLLPENIPNSVEPLPFMPHAEPEVEGAMRRDHQSHGGTWGGRQMPSVPLLTMPLCMTFARSIGGKSTFGRRLSVNVFSRAMCGVDMGGVHVPITALDRNKFGLDRMHYNRIDRGT